MNIIVCGHHGQGAFRFPMKILYVMNNGKIYESIQPVGCILWKKDNGIILKRAIIKDLGDSNNLLKESMIFNNQHISLADMYVTGDLTFLLNV